MQRKNLIATLALSAAAPALAATGTVTFQNGVNGYTGTVNELISTATADTVIAGTNILALDGLDSATPANSPDAQGLIRFDSIFGATASQIPAGATVLSATLTLTTHNGSNSQSGGPYGVATLLRPFDPATTTYNNFVTDTTAPVGTPVNVGPSYLSGTATRAIAGIGAQAINTTVSVNVTQAVRDWAAGTTPNYGFAVQAGTGGNSTDGWTVRSATHATVASRPQLSVTYTTDPVSVTHLQQGVNGYSGTTMAYVQRDLTTDGQYISQNFLDLADPTVGDCTAVMRFDGLAAAKPTPDAVLLSATLVVSTGESSDNSRSPGEWQLDALDADFTVAKGYSEYGATGPSGTKLSSVTGMINGSQALFDVTAYVQAALAGGTNYGWALRSAGTTDGWMINFTGAEDASARPDLQLVWSTASSVPEPTALATLAIGSLAMLRRRRA
ncbi:MAG: DNRLRE domain-containing protein [Tepidisphaeraceae bacterium]